MDGKTVVLVFGLQILKVMIRRPTLGRVEETGTVNALMEVWVKVMLFWIDIPLDL